MSPNRDSFAVQLAFKTGGDASKWSLTQLSVAPHDPKFSCGDGYEKASKDNPIRLTKLTAEIVCSKSANMHLILAVDAVDTTEGGGSSFDLESIDEQINK